MTEAIGMYPRSHYPREMERRPQTQASGAAAAEAAALAGPAMFDCLRFPGATRISERQCLVNQERAAVGGFPSFCVACPEGAEIKARHPGGPPVKVKHLALDGRVNRPLEIKLAREQAGRPEPAPAVKHEESVCKISQVEKPVPAKEKDMATVHLSEKEAGKMLGPQRLAEILAAPAVKHEESVCEKSQVEIPAPASSENEGKNMTKIMTDSSPDQDAGGRDARPTGEGETSPEAPRCKKHPEEPQMRSKKGFLMGRCLLCMAELKSSPNWRGTSPGPVARKRALKVAKLRQVAASAPTEEVKAAPPGDDWRISLLAKFPGFDPAWSPEVQGTWLEGFSRLCGLFEVKGPPAGTPAPRGGALDRPAQVENPCHRPALPEGEVGRPTRDLPKVEASTDPKSGPPALKKPPKRRWDKKSMTPEVAKSLGYI